MQGCKDILGEAEIAQAHRDIETEPANWKPLEKRVGRRCAEFMWVFRQNGLEYYKHVDTRRYLILDQKGKCYRQKGDQLVQTGFREELRFITRAI